MTNTIDDAFEVHFKAKDRSAVVNVKKGFTKLIRTLQIPATVSLDRYSMVIRGMSEELVQKKVREYSAVCDYIHGYEIIRLG